MNIEEARRSLPWYAAGTLSPDEAGALEALLAQSPELQQELSELRALIGALGTRSASEPVFRPSLIADAWQRIDEYERSQRASERPTSREQRSSQGVSSRGGQAVSARGGRVSSLWQGLLGSWGDLSIAGRWAVTAQAAVILVLGAVLVGAHVRPGEGGFTTLSGGGSVASTSGTAAAGSGPRFTVAFQPSATESQIRGVLSALGLQIISGPSGEDLYTLQLVERAASPSQVAPQRSTPEQATTEQATSEQATTEQATTEQATTERLTPEQVLQRLRASSEVVRFATREGM